MSHRRSLWLTIASLIVSLPTSASAAPTVVVGDQLIEAGTHTFTEPIVIAPGSTLTVRDATLFLDAPRNCPIRGTIEFCHRQIFVSPGGRFVAERTTIDTHLAVSIDNPLSGYQIFAEAGTIEIIESTLRGANLVGGEAPAVAPSIIRDSTFRDCIQPAWFTRGMASIIEGNDIKDCRLGIDARDADHIIRDNRIEVLGYGIDLQGTLVGDKILPTRGLVEGNTVIGGVAAFYTLNSWGSIVRNNTFRDAEYGAVIGVNAGAAIITAEDITFEGNLLSGNEAGIRAYATLNQDQVPDRAIVVPIRGNAIVDTACIDIWVREPLDPGLTLSVDARENWWGTPAGPQDKPNGCPAFDGDVLADPWLTASPLD